MSRLGEIIKEYRECNNLSVNQFAKMCELSRTYIDKLEENKKNLKPIEPTLYSLGKIANAMGLSITELMYFVENHNGLEFYSSNTAKKTKIIFVNSHGENLGIYYSSIIPNIGHKISRSDGIYEIKDIIYKITNVIHHVEIIIENIKDKKTV